MKTSNFTGPINLDLPNTCVYDEGTMTWRVIYGGILKIDEYDSKQDAIDALKRWSPPSRPTSFSHTHQIVKCACGVIIMQCKCFSKDKNVVISSEPCTHKDH